MYTHLAAHVYRAWRGKKKMEIWNTKTVKEGAILSIFEKPLLPFFCYSSPPCFAFHLASLFNSSPCFLPLSKRNCKPAQMFSTIGLCLVHWANGHFFGGSSSAMWLFTDNTTAEECKHNMGEALWGLRTLQWLTWHLCPIFITTALHRISNCPEKNV